MRGYTVDLGHIKFAYDDGGRAAAGYKGTTGDCGVRAAAIAVGIPYQTVYDAINELGKAERPRRNGKRSGARGGIWRKTYNKYLESVGWEWIPTMRIGSGCRVHLRADELPDGPIICRLSRHYAAVVDGVLLDISDCSRDGTRCVYGYWRPGAQAL